MTDPVKPPLPPLRFDGALEPDHRPVRMSLIRRIKRGEVCGYRKANGYMCLSRPIDGGYCRTHGNGKAGKRSNNVAADTTKSPLDRVLALWCSEDMPPEMLHRLSGFLDAGIDLSSELMILRMRLASLTRAYSNGRMTSEQFDRRAALLTRSIDRLVRTQSENRDTVALDTDVDVDLWDPIAEQRDTEGRDEDEDEDEA